MDRALVLFGIGLIFGGGIGFVVAAGNGVTFDGHDHADPTAHSAAQVDHAAMGHGNMDHAMMHDTLLEVPSEDAPEVSMMLMPDAMTGYNLHVMVDNFVFSPEGASLADVPGEGHAHVYVNGKKLSRLYGEWMHIASLPKGEVTVEVTLNSNDHRPLAIDGAPISANTTLTVE
ncbi:MAG: hypothetical protein ACSHWS_14145 [Sulfitobacter sp.]